MLFIWVSVDDVSVTHIPLQKYPSVKLLSYSGKIEQSLSVILNIIIKQYFNYFRFLLSYRIRNCKLHFLNYSYYFADYRTCSLDRRLLAVKNV